MHHNFQASETLQSAIVWVKYASTYHSKQVESTVGYWVRWGMKGGGLCLACKVQSKLRYPSGALADSQNQFREGELTKHFSLFLPPSVAAFHTSLFALYHCLPVFSCSSIYLLPFYHTLSLTHTLSLAVTSPHPLLWDPLYVCVCLWVCFQAVINQRSDLVGGKGCEARSLMLTGWLNQKLPTVWWMDLLYGEEFHRGYISQKSACAYT